MVLTPHGGLCPPLPRAGLRLLRRQVTRARQRRARNKRESPGRKRQSLSPPPSPGAADDAGNSSWRFPPKRRATVSLTLRCGAQSPGSSGWLGHWLRDVSPPNLTVLARAPSFSLGRVPAEHPLAEHPLAEHPPAGYSSAGSFLRAQRPRRSSSASVRVGMRGRARSKALRSTG